MGEGEFLESRSRSFVHMWPVADEYEIRDGFVVATGSKKEWYLPMGRPELPGEFAKLATGSEEDVLEFVKRYGLLGYRQAFRFPLEVVSADKMKLYNDSAPGDPLSWIFAHARAVNLVMQLAECLNDPAGLQALISTLTVEENGRVYVCYGLPRRGSPPGRVTMLPFPAPEETARRIIADILNANLEGIQREIAVEYVPADQAGNEQYVPGFTSIFSFRNLLDCIYWLVADAIVGAKIRTCAYCGRPFIAPNDKTKYCPPLQWETVSRCMNRAKQRRFWTEERKAQRRAQRKQARKNGGE